MDHRAPSTTRSPRRAPRTALALLVALALTLPAAAQRLPAYLPADTVVALGAVDLASQEAAFAGVLADWERYGVGPALLRAFDGVDAGALGVPQGDDLGEVALPPALDGLELLDLIGREAWVAVSVSPFNPLPTVTLVALVDDSTASRFDAVLADAAQEPGARTLREGDAELVALLVDGVPVAAARYGDLLALATNPDVLRGVLRAAQGGSEPSFASSDAYGATLATLAPGQLYGYLDLDPVARALTPFASGLGFDRSVARLAAALETLGTSAGVVRFTSLGSESESVQHLGRDGGDAPLLALLSASDPAPRRLLDAVPGDALSVTVNGADVEAGFDYLVRLLSELPELALRDPEGLLRDLVGIDLRRDVFAWMDGGWMSVTTGLGSVVDPGVPADELLGESAFVFLTSDPTAAAAGLERSAGSLASIVSAFADPMGRGGVVAPTVRDVAGVRVSSYEVFPGLALHVAAADGFAMIATSEGAAASVAQAIGAGAVTPATVARLLPEVPEGAVRFTISDDRATLLGTADQLTQQVQLLAGLGGGLDFDAVEAATEALEGFLEALAARLGGSVAYAVVDGATVRSVSRSAFDGR